MTILTRDQWEKRQAHVVSLYVKGLSIRAIEDATGISRNAIHTMLKTAPGVQMRKAGGPRTEPLVREGLTARQLAVLNYISEGMEDREITKLMSLSYEQVRRSVLALYSVFKTKNRVHLVVLAYRRGFVDLKDRADAKEDGSVDSSRAIASCEVAKETATED